MTMQCLNDLAWKTFSCRRSGWVMLVIAFACVLPLGAKARLDETEEKCQVRYGEPVKTDSIQYMPLLAGAVNRTYQMTNWRIRVAFVKGKAVKVAYAKNRVGFGIQRIEDDEVQAVLDAEAQGNRWVVKTNATSYAFTPKHWENKNGYRACLDGSREWIVFDTEASDEFIKARAEEQKRQPKVPIPKF